MKETLVKIESLSLTLLQKKGMFQKERTQVLHSVDLQLQKGSILVLLGESGCGKTLLAKGLLGLLPKEAEVSGVVHYGGLPLSLLNFQKIASEKVIYSPQTTKTLNPLLKIEEQLPFSSSNGTQKQSLFSLLHEKPHADCIIADEPTLAADPKTAKENLQNLRKSKENNKAILVMTQNIDLALEIADQIAVFRQGRLVETLSPEEFLQEEGKEEYPKELYRSLSQ